MAQKIGFNNKPAPITINKAIWIGLTWVLVPVLPLMIGVPALLIIPPIVFYQELEISGWWAFLLAVFMIFSVVSGFILAWTWWSVMVPKWRLWAYRRVDDIFQLKAKAVEVGLTWPDGHFFEQTEIKSKAHERAEQELVRKAQQKNY